RRRETLVAGRAEELEPWPPALRAGECTVDEKDGWLHVAAGYARRDHSMMAHDQKTGRVSDSTPPIRKGAHANARPVPSSTSTAMPEMVAGPSAGVKRSPGTFWRKRR